MRTRLDKRQECNSRGRLQRGPLLKTAKQPRRVTFTSSTTRIATKFTRNQAVAHIVDQTNPHRDGGSGCAEAERHLSQHRKSVLICPECGREAPAEDDWVREQTDREDRIALGCPTCGTHLAVRGNSSSSANFGQDVPTPAVSGTTFPQLAASAGLQATALQLDFWTRLWTRSTSNRGRGRS